MWPIVSKSGNNTPFLANTNTGTGTKNPYLTGVCLNFDAFLGQFEMSAKCVGCLLAATKVNARCK